jgi:hypothetical protein
MARRFITDQMAARMPALAEAPDADRKRILNVSEVLYGWVLEGEWATESELRKRAESEELSGPDMVTAALEVLEQSGRLISLAATERQAGLAPLPTPDEEKA